MVFVAPHPMGPWRFQTNVNDGLYLPFSPRGEPPPPPPVPAGATASCSDLSGEWASSVLTPNYQPLRAGLIVTKLDGRPHFLPPPPPPPQTTTISYYNITSKSETHWPAVHAGGWLMEVDAAAKTVRWPIAARAPGSSGPTKLSPWLNPLSNGQKLPPAPDCTMLSGGQGVRLCKLPWCGESVRPVKAQQFNVLQLGGQHVYYGERWQSTPTGYKADDFSYLQPLSFDEHGVVQRLKFADSFELAI